MTELEQPALYEGQSGTPAAELAAALKQIPSQFGRIVFLASCRDFANGNYWETGLGEKHGSAATSETLANAHRQAFSEWLGLNLAEQRKDICQYIAGLGGDGLTILRTWWREGTCRDFIPPRASEADRNLYLSDLETLLNLFGKQDGPSRRPRWLPPATAVVASGCAALALAHLGLPPVVRLAVMLLSLGTGIAVYSFCHPAALALLTAPWILMYGVPACPGLSWGWPGLALLGAVHFLSKTSRVAREEREQYRMALDSASDGIALLAWDGRFLEANPRACEMLGYCRSELRRQTLGGLAPRPASGHPCADGRGLVQGRDSITELTIRRKDGTRLTLESNAKLLSNGKVLAILRDITARKAGQERLNASLREKETLLKEIHHRVKNNLQVISSLLDLEAAQQKQPEALEALEQSQQRIKAIALVHQHLYQAADLSRLDLRKYLENLAGGIFQAFGPGFDRIRFSLDVQAVPLNLDQAVPCGLIVNELVLNCIKHAFRDGRTGKVLIHARLTGDDTVSIGVRDNGVGLPAHFDPAHTETLGLQLVRALVRQLHGSLEVATHNGTEFRIAFPRLETALKKIL